MTRRFRRALVCASLLAVAGAAGSIQASQQARQLEAMRGLEAPADAIWIDSLDLSRLVQRRQTPRAGQTLARARGAARGRGGGAPASAPITLGGVVYPHGIGTLSINELIVDLKGAATRFISMVGIDDAETGQGSVSVEVWVDNRKAFGSGVLRAGDAPLLVDVDLRGARFMELVIDDGGDVSTGDYADWGGGLIYLLPDAVDHPESWTFPGAPAPPIASGWPAEPRINAPRIAGGTPGRPFLFRIPATGEAPLGYAARNLPAGLALDPSTGIITGAIASAGRTVVDVTVSNARGSDTRTLTIVGGDDALALTPPLGWNSWNVWGRSVDADKVRAAADAMVSTGLAAHGYQFINIDDGWEGERDADGVLQPNEKFPDMKALADDVHALGLKIGIYSSPGPRTCQGLEGSYQHEAIDARTWADWGIDLLKHDWCSYSGIAADDSLAERQKPYRVMRQALDAVNRDIVYSLCQYGMGNVWEWGESVGGNYWRTTGDLTDVWSNMSAVGFRQAGRERWSKPGHWTDPDMLVVGKVGWGSDTHDTRLTPDEQMVHIALWSLQAAPLLIGADLSEFDAFTTALMTNPEVLEINQDVLGRGASRIYQRERLELWARPLADGTIAAGLFNRGLEAVEMTATWGDLGISGAQPVRDVWFRRDLGVRDAAFTARVPAHGVVLVKIGRPRGR